MKRILKFRAWSTKYKKFLATGFHIIGETTLFDLLNQHRLEELNDIEIQQFTGLQDENGKDIYEGDILKWPKGWMYDEMNGKVEWIVNGFSFANKKVNWCLGRKVEGDIIGNIFENPDLLS